MATDAENWRDAAETDASTEADPLEQVRDRILAAALPNIPFDGWTDEMLAQAVADAGVNPHEAKLAVPRPIDLAITLHRQGDRALAKAMAEAGLDEMRIRDRVTFGVRTRIEIAEPHREAVRRAASMMALPTNAATSTRLIWETADTIWTALGDPSEDLNWYSKRMILGGVYSAVFLYWLGDESEGREKTWEFLDRRIEGVMRFEKTKAAINANPLGKLLMTGPNWLASRIRKPGSKPVDTGTPVDLPG